MKYIYFSLYSLLLSSCFTFWMKSSVCIWMEFSVYNPENFESWQDPLTMTFFAGKFLKTCIFAQIASVFCNLVFKAQFLKVICWLMVELSGHRFKQSFQKYRFFIALNTVPSFFKGVYFRSIWEKVEIWRLTLSFNPEANPKLNPWG